MGKLTCPVLRGLGVSNDSRLPDKPDPDLDEAPPMCPVPHDRHPPFGTVIVAFLRRAVALARLNSGGGG